MDWMSFLTIVVFVFAVAMIVAGVFTAYFGSGKSRTVGLALLFVGLAIGLVWGYLVVWSDVSPFTEVATWDVVYESLLTLLAAVIGAAAAVGIFLVAVMKS
jgi:hypothetical protein